MAAIRGHRLVPVEQHLPLCPTPVRRFFEAAFSLDRAARPRTAAQFAKRLAQLR